MKKPVTQEELEIYRAKKLQSLLVKLEKPEILEVFTRLKSR